MRTTSNTNGFRHSGRGNACQGRKGEPGRDTGPTGRDACATPADSPNRTRAIRLMAPITCLAITIVLLAACGQAAIAPTPLNVTSGVTRVAGGSKWDSLLEGARKERSIVIYATLTSETRQAIAQSFKNRFDIEAEFVSGTGAELANKMLNERRGGLYLADIILTGSSSLVNYMKKEKLLDPIDSQLLLPEVLNAQLWQGGALPYVDKDHMIMTLVAQFNSGVVRNTDMVPANALSSFKDLLKPEWKGKLLMYDPSISGSGNNLLGAWVYGIWGLDATKEFLRGLVKQEIALTRDPQLGVEWIARGKYPIGMGTWPENTVALITEGAHIDYVKMSEGGFVTSGNGGLALPSQRPHPNASAVFVNWILSQEGQSIFARAFGSTSRRVDAPPSGVYPALIPDPSVKAYTEDEDGVLGRGALMSVAKEILVR